MARDRRLWRLRSFEAAKALLRARQHTTQAGFTAEYIPKGRLEHRPILISDGPVHDEQRKKVARFFAPSVVHEYRQQISDSARDRLDAMSLPGGVDFDELALHFTVEVTAHIVGLSHERQSDTPQRRERRIRAMAERLVSFFDQPPFDLTRADLGRTPGQWAKAAYRGLHPIWRLYWAHVRPAVRQRRRRPRQDVISHLIAEGYSMVDILIEAVTYGTAGMVTTREFIAMAAWRLLTTPTLARHYRVAPEEERLAILQELIRLAPPVGHLYRRAHGRIVVQDGSQEHVIEAGQLVDIDVRAANRDPKLFTQPLECCPGRPLPKGVRPTVLTFGDGAHRCPGEHLALLEADLLLTQLFARNPRLVGQPDVSWDDLVSGYQIRGLRIAYDAAAPSTHDVQDPALPSADGA